MRNKPIDHEICQKVLKLRRAGWTLRKIADCCDVSPTFILSYCRKHGFARRSKLMTNTHIDQIIHLDRSNYSYPEMARSVGLSVAQVRKLLIRLGRVIYTGKLCASPANNPINTLELKPEHLSRYKDVVKARKVWNSNHRGIERV